MPPASSGHLAMKMHPGRLKGAAPLRRLAALPQVTLQQERPPAIFAEVLSRALWSARHCGGDAVYASSASLLEAPQLRLRQPDFFPTQAQNLPWQRLLDWWRALHLLCPCSQVIAQVASASGPSPSLCLSVWLLEFSHPGASQGQQLLRCPHSRTHLAEVRWSLTFGLLQAQQEAILRELLEEAACEQWLVPELLRSQLRWY
jgi:hypothetical protein